MSCTPNIRAHNVNNIENSGLEMRETLPHTGMEELESYDDAEDENAISENESFYSAEDSVSEKEELTLEESETDGGALKRCS